MTRRKVKRINLSIGVNRQNEWKQNKTTTSTLFELGQPSGDTVSDMIAASRVSIGARRRHWREHGVTLQNSTSWPVNHLLHSLCHLSINAYIHTYGNPVRYSPCSDPIKKPLIRHQLLIKTPFWVGHRCLMPSFPCVASLQDASPAEWKMDFASTTQIHLRRRRNKVTASALTFPRCSGSSQSSHNLSTSECARRTKFCHVATFIKKKLSDDNYQKVKWPNFQKRHQAEQQERQFWLFCLKLQVCHTSPCSDTVLCFVIVWDVWPC